MQGKFAACFRRAHGKGLVFRQHFLFARLEKLRPGCSSGLGVQRPGRWRIAEDVFLTALRGQGEGMRSVVVAQGNGWRGVPDHHLPQIGVVFGFCGCAFFHARCAFQGGFVGIEVIACGKVDGDFGEVAVAVIQLMNGGFEDFFSGQRLGGMNEEREQGGKQPQQSGHRNFLDK